MSWTEDKVAKLKELWGKGNTASQIAEIIGGISRNAVIGKAHRLNLSAKIKTRTATSNQNFDNSLLDKNSNTKRMAEPKRKWCKTRKSWRLHTYQRQRNKNRLGNGIKNRYRKIHIRQLLRIRYYNTSREKKTGTR